MPTTQLHERLCNVGREVLIARPIRLGTNPQNHIDEQTRRQQLQPNEFSKTALDEISRNR